MSAPYPPSMPFTKTPMTAPPKSSTVALDAWGWRIPFLAGIPLGAIGFYVRRRLHEPPQYERLEAADAVAKAPLVEVLRTHAPALVRSMGMLIGWLFSGGVVLIYLPTYLNRSRPGCGSAASASRTR